MIGRDVARVGETRTLTAVSGLCLCRECGAEDEIEGGNAIGRDDQQVVARPRKRPALCRDEPASVLRARSRPVGTRVARGSRTPKGNVTAYPKSEVGQGVNELVI